MRNTESTPPEPGRRRFLQLSAAAVAATALATGRPSPLRAASMNNDMPELIKAFCIDFNWEPGGAHAKPGTFTQADPKAHVQWYKDLGANTIQTFCVSFNGYAWYPSEVAPINPGLEKKNFLGDMVELGHGEGMKVMGYFTFGNNPVWEAKNPTLKKDEGTDYIKIPATLEYLDYFCRSIEDALKKTDIDGFMVDWVRPTQHPDWLPAEKRMYQQLMGEKFPSSGPPSAQAILEFDRRAMARAWRHIRWAAYGTRRVKIWTNHPFVARERPLWEGHILLKEVDWVLNEDPDPKWLAWLKKYVGDHTVIIQNLCGWGNHDARIWKELDLERIGLYGFAQADRETTFPTGEGDRGLANLKNIEIIREAFKTVK